MTNPGPGRGFSFGVPTHTGAAGAIYRGAGFAGMPAPTDITAHTCKALLYLTKDPTFHRTPAAMPVYTRLHIT
ncbi:hypothetical protein DV532_02015 [Pseudomonas sp. Leaf58]|nr:hypothetical protein DV532_02015 [Pseudomonas sp. Leaf58]